MTETARNMRDRAVALANQGFKVFPLKQGEKVPFVPWGVTVPQGEFFDRVPTDSAKKVYSYWTQRDGEPANHNIGICTNDLLVIDVDNKNGKNGEAAFRILMASSALGISSTVESATPTGGRHVFYQLPPADPTRLGERARNTVGALGEGVDTRGWHGYVVAPGSVVAAGEYRWMREPGTTPMAIAPEVLLQRLRASKSDQQKATVVEGLELDTQAAIERAIVWLRDGALEAVENAGGDFTTFKVACNVADIGISELECFSLMANYWNVEKAHPPWSMEELEQKVANAYAYRRDPVGVSAPEGQFDVVELVENEAKPGTTETAPKKRQLFWRGFNESSDRALESTFDALVDDYLERKAMSVLYGESGAGKTFVALAFSYHVAARQDWNGRKVNGGPVMYVAAEAGETINGRLAALRAHYKPEKEPPLAVVPCLVNLFNPGADLRELIELVNRWADLCGERVALIVLDTLARIMGSGDENTARDMGILVQNIDRLRVATGAHVMVVHHSGKNKANGARGSSALRAATDTEIEVEAHRIKVRKQRATEEAKDVNFRLLPVTIGKKPDGGTVTSCVMQLGGTVDFEPQLTNEQQGWVDELRAITIAFGLEEFTRKDMKLAWEGVDEKTIRNRAGVLVTAEVLSKVEGSQAIYLWSRS